MSKITLTFAEHERQAISDALKIAVNNCYQNLSAENQQTLLCASHVWRTSQPDYDPEREFKKDCQRWGCD